MALCLYRVWDTVAEQWREIIASSPPTESDLGDPANPIDQSKTAVLECYDDSSSQPGTADGVLGSPIAAASAVLQDIIPCLGIPHIFRGNGKIGSNDPFYVRTLIPAGRYDRMQCGIYSGGSSSRKVDMGLYADAGSSPHRPSGGLLHSTGEVDTERDSDDADESYFLTCPLDTVLELTEPTYLWMAIVANTSSLRLITTPNKFRVNWTDRIYVEKDNHGFPLGSLPGSWSGLEDSAIPYIALVREGADALDAYGDD